MPEASRPVRQKAALDPAKRPCEGCQTLDARLAANVGPTPAGELAITPQYLGCRRLTLRDVSQLQFENQEAAAARPHLPKTRCRFRPLLSYCPRVRLPNQIPTSMTGFESPDDLPLNQRRWSDYLAINETPLVRDLCSQTGDITSRE